jgi:hypothetical protein
VQSAIVYVDDTLVRSVGSKLIPNPQVISCIQELHGHGKSLYLWSSAGASDAKSSAEELGIADCFTASLPKPDFYIDDQAVQEWRYSNHVLPRNVTDFAKSISS